MSTSELAPGSKLRHPKFGLGMILSADESYYKIYFYNTEEIKTLARDYDGFEIEEAKKPDFPMLTQKRCRKGHQRGTDSDFRANAYRAIRREMDWR